MDILFTETIKAISNLLIALIMLGLGLKAARGRLVMRGSGGLA
jgi:hypothetical protein